MPSGVASDAAAIRRLGTPGRRIVVIVVISAMVAGASEEPG
jgi:hypothetical protein